MNNTKMTTKEKILEEFEKRFGAYAIMGKAERFYNGAFANEARILKAQDFLSQAIDETVRAVCEECLEKIGEDENIRFLSYVSTSNSRARNKLRQELRQAINSLKGKYE